jgi:protein subunit release factor B
MSTYHFVVQLRPEDLRVDAYKSSGPGGSTEAAVRITHAPSGIVVTANEFDSASANKQQALERLAELLADWSPRENEERRVEHSEIPRLGSHISRTRRVQPAPTVAVRAAIPTYPDGAGLQGAGRRRDHDGAAGSSTA